jgi:hypothetical protein
MRVLCRSMVNGSAGIQKRYTIQGLQLESVLACELSCGGNGGSFLRIDSESASCMHCVAALYWYRIMQYSVQHSVQPCTGTRSRSTACSPVLVQDHAVQRVLHKLYCRHMIAAHHSVVQTVCHI